MRQAGEATPWVCGDGRHGWLVALLTLGAIVGGVVIGRLFARGKHK